jgi:hypothetical protein
VTADERLAWVISGLEAVDISCLVMGGHAVRFYGLSRNTNDFDLQAAPDQWGELPDRLARSPLFPNVPPVEGPSWRPGAFRRFRLGVLPDGRDEWLEFWKENHLLPPYDQLRPRAERGEIAGREVWFLGLADLIRSKETERDTDWSDVAVLEQFLDARLLARVRAGASEPAEALAALRSRAGFEAWLAEGLLADAGVVSSALARATLPVTQAFLLPYAPAAAPAEPVLPIEPVILARLRTTAPASPLHLSLVEVIRRRYIAFRKETDRKDKEAIRASQP